MTFINDSNEEDLDDHQWRLIEERYQSEEPLMAKIIDIHEDNFIVTVEGIRGIVPFSSIFRPGQQLNTLANDGEGEITPTIESMKGKELQLTIIQIDRTQNLVVLSQHFIFQKLRERSRRRKELLEELRIGEVRHGVVRAITDFGAFVDLGGADGLVHKSQLSWDYINHPGEVVHTGQEVEVLVTEIDKEQQKIMLTMKHMLTP